LVAVVLVALIVGGSALMRGCTPQTNPNLVSNGTPVTVTVANGAGGLEIADTLYEAGLITGTKPFTDALEKAGAAASPKPGTYTITGGTSIDDIIALLAAGPKPLATVTVPEGYTLSAVATAVDQASAGTISRDAFLAAAENVSAYAADYSFLQGVTSLEGFLFPKTYDLASDATADSLIRAMLDQYQAEIATLDYSFPTSRGLSQYQALILASIVEKESDSNTRGQVAAVFYNRLSNFDDPNYGFLQSDATTAYEVGHDPTAEEVHADTPYSTYTHEGLPPTPICQPGLASLQAVCSPDSELLDNGYYYFYFALKDDGTLEYSFSQTLDEHNAAIAADM
ncbi:MAG: endolytic transglycosylase MltG, partial [Coriobacteriia bacterium]|nr:endolytic transglycosylase MltG [Coriobacteriia bacterium]